MTSRINGVPVVHFNGPCPRSERRLVPTHHPLLITHHLILPNEAMFKKHFNDQPNQRRPCGSLQRSMPEIGETARPHSSPITHHSSLDFAKRSHVQETLQ